jgi:hypothetical protein
MASMVVLAAVMAFGPGAWAQSPAMSDKDKTMEKDKMEKSGAMPDKMDKGKMEKGNAMEKDKMSDKGMMQDKGMAQDKDKMEKKP